MFLPPQPFPSVTCGRPPVQAPSTGICEGLTGLARGRGSRSPAPRAPLYWADCSRPSPGYTLGFERGLPALGKAWPAPPATCPYYLPSAVLGRRIHGCCLHGPSAVGEQAALNSLGLHFLVSLTCPGQGREARYPLTPPVGGRLTQDLLPALGPPSPLDSSSSLPSMGFGWSPDSISLCTSSPNCWSLPWTPPVAGILP